MAGPAPRTVNVFGSDQETTPLAVFETPITVNEIRKTLGLAKGGLKRKGAGEVFTNNLNAGGDFTFIGGPKFVISVNFLGTTAMVNVKSAKSKIRSLVQEIGSHFASLVAGDPADTKIAELRSGGVLLNLNDVIDNVLVDGSSVEAIDFKRWSEGILKNCDTAKLKALQAELDGVSSDKWAEVGFVKGTPKVYVKLGQGYQKNIKHFKLELLDAESLQHYPKDGRHLVTYADGASEEGNKWVLESHVRVVKGTVVAIEVSVRASTSKRATIREIPVELKDGVIVFGKAVTLQSDNPASEKQYTLPPAKRTGPNLEADAARDASLPKEKKPPTQTWTPAEGVALSATCKGVYAEQRTGRGDEWYMCYYFPLEFKNAAADAVTFPGTTISYKGADGNWVDCKSENVHCGGHSGGWRFDWDWRGSTGGKFALGKKDVVEIAMRAAFGMPKSVPCGEKRRTHRSLPQPLKLRLVFNTIEGKQATLELEQVNDEPLDLPTQASRKEYHKKEVTNFFFCDEPVTENRIFVDVLAKEEQNDWEYVPINWTGNSGKYVYVSDLRKWAYQPLKEGKTETPLTDIGKEEEGKKIKAFGLIDPAIGAIYAIRFELSTTTSETVDYLLMPHLKTPYD